MIFPALIKISIGVIEFITIIELTIRIRFYFQQIKQLEHSPATGEKYVKFSENFRWNQQDPDILQQRIKRIEKYIKGSHFISLLVIIVLLGFGLIGTICIDLNTHSIQNRGIIINQTASVVSFMFLCLFLILAGSILFLIYTLQGQSFANNRLQNTFQNEKCTLYFILIVFGSTYLLRCCCDWTIFPMLEGDVSDGIVGNQRENSFFNLALYMCLSCIIWDLIPNTFILLAHHKNFRQQTTHFADESSSLPTVFEDDSTTIIHISVQNKHELETELLSNESNPVDYSRSYYFGNQKINNLSIRQNQRRRSEQDLKEMQAVYSFGMLRNALPKLENLSFVQKHESNEI